MLDFSENINVDRTLHLFQIPEKEKRKKKNVRQMAQNLYVFLKINYAEITSQTCIKWPYLFTVNLMKFQWNFTIISSKFWWNFTEIL